MRIPPLDASWFAIEGAERPAHIGCLVQCTPPADASPSFCTDLVRAWRLHGRVTYPFNVRPKLIPVPTWERLKDDQVDLDYHFRHSALPSGGGERELGILISRLHSHPLDRRRPLWEMHLIEGLDGHRFALYLKVHHSLMDGVAGIRMIGRALAADAGARDQPPIWASGLTRTSPAATPVSLADRTSDLLRRSTVLPKRSLSLTRQTVGGARALAGVTLSQVRRGLSPSPGAAAVPFRAPLTPLNGTVHGPRRFATHRFSMEEMRSVGQSHSATVNDVLLAVCGGALRTYLQDLSSLPRASLTATLPVSIRMDGDREGGNAITYIQAKLATDVADPVDRVAAVAASTRAAKSMLGKLPRSAMQAYTAMIMTPYMAQLALGLGARTPPMHNVVVSNVPGPRRQRYIEGATVDSIYPLSILFDGQALNITVVSYAGYLCAGFTGCRDSMPSMQRIAVLARDSFDTLSRHRATS